MGVREDKKLRTRNMILEKSSSLFIEKGVDNVGMRELALNCELGIGTYYNYFQSKDEVVISLIENLIENFLKHSGVENLKTQHLITYLKESKNLFVAFLPIAMRVENEIHLKNIRKLLLKFLDTQNIFDPFYAFLSLGHFSLSNNDLDTKLFYTKLYGN